MADTIFKNPDEAQTALEALRDGSVNWLVFGYEGRIKNAVYLQGQGDKGLDEALPKLKEDGCHYLLISVPMQGEGSYATAKVVCVTWVGKKAKPMLRARSTQHRLPVYKACSRVLPIASELQALAPEELSHDLLVQKLVGSKLLVKGDAKQEAAAATRSRAATGSFERFGFVNESQASKAVSSVYHPGEEGVNWVLLGNSPEDPGKIDVLQQGEGGLSEVLPLLKDDDIFYFVMGVETEDEGDYTQTKYIFVSWVGVNCHPMQKARSSQQRNILYKFAKKAIQLHGELQVLHPSELSEQLVREKLTLSKERAEDHLLECARRDEEKKKQREQATSSQGSSMSSAAHQFVNMEDKKLESPFVDDDAATAAIKNVGEPTHEHNWVVFGYEGENTAVALLGVGSGNSSTWKHHANDSNVIYTLYGLVDSAEGAYSTVKFMLITWVGSKVPALHKARSSQHRVHIYTICNRYLQLAAEYHAPTLEALCETEFLKKLAGTKLLASDRDAQAAERAAERARREASGRHGFKAGENASQFEWKEEAAARDALKAILDSENPITWALFGQSADDSLNSVDVLRTGSSEFDDLKQHLSDDNVRYGVVALTTDEFSGGQQEGVYVQTRHLFFSWVGEAVKPLEKARSSQHRVALYTYCKTILQLHGEIQATNLSEMTLDRALASVTGERGIVH